MNWKGVQTSLVYLILGLVLLGVALYLSTRFQAPTALQSLVLRILVALGAAVAASSLAGSIGIELPTGIKAGGSLAVFVLILYFNPPDQVRVAMGLPLGNSSSTTSTVSVPVQAPPSKPKEEWLGFANNTTQKDQETALLNLVHHFRRVEMPGNDCRFTILCQQEKMKCKIVRDWKGVDWGCEEECPKDVDGKTLRDGSRLALCVAQ
jgi:hypothetical protein